MCSNENYIVHRHYLTKDLSQLWQTSFGFDPFLNKNIGEKLVKLQCTKCNLIHFDPVIIGDGVFYEKLSKNSWYYEEVKWEFDESVKLILKHKPHSLLEIGCGNGNFLNKIVKAIDRVEGIEINEDAIEKCKKINLNVSSTPLEKIDKKFDMIVLFEVMEHLGNPYEVLQKAKALLNDNGILVIAVPNPDSYIKEIDTLLLDMPPHHSTGWCSDTFDYIAKHYNFESIHYALEPLRDIHHKYYLNTKLKNLNDNPNPHNLKGRFKLKVKNFMTDIFNPVLNRLDYLSYKLDKDKVIGQTHLVAFKKI